MKEKDHSSFRHPTIKTYIKNLSILTFLNSKNICKNSAQCIILIAKSTLCRLKCIKKHKQLNLYQYYVI